MGDCMAALSMRRSEGFSAAYEIGWRYPGLLENGAQSALWHVAWMVRNGCVPKSGRIEPNLVTACSLTIELKSKGFEPLNDFSILKAGQSPHLGIDDEGIIEFITGRWQGRLSFALLFGFQELLGDIAGDLDGFLNSTPLHDKSLYDVGRCEIDALREFFNVEVDDALHVNLFRE